MAKGHASKKGGSNSGGGKRICCLAAGLLIGGFQFPADPDGTLERVEGGSLRVGVTEHDPWVRFEGARPACTTKCFTRTRR